MRILTFFFLFPFAISITHLPWVYYEILGLEVLSNLSSGYYMPYFSLVVIFLSLFFLIFFVKINKNSAIRNNIFFLIIAGFFYFSYIFFREIFVLEVSDFFAKFEYISNALFFVLMSVGLCALFQNETKLADRFLKIQLNVLNIFSLISLCSIIFLANEFIKNPSDFIGLTKLISESIWRDHGQHLIGYNCNLALFLVFFVLNKEKKKILLFTVVLQTALLIILFSKINLVIFGGILAFYIFSQQKRYLFYLYFLVLLSIFIHIYPLLTSDLSAIERLNGIFRGINYAFSNVIVFAFGGGVELANILTFDTSVIVHSYLVRIQISYGIIAVIAFLVFLGATLFFSTKFSFNTMFFAKVYFITVLLFTDPNLPFVLTLVLTCCQFNKNFQKKI